MTANFFFEAVRHLLSEIDIMISVSHDNMKRVENLGGPNDPRVTGDPKLPKAIGESIDFVNYATQMSDKLFGGLKCDHIDRAANSLGYWAQHEPRYWSELNTRTRAGKEPGRRKIFRCINRVQSIIALVHTCTRIQIGLVPRMADYDFHHLSPHDFEKMSRDLLQADWGVTLESFKTGKDGGTDFRYAQAGAHTIVQCKHYVRTGLSGLLRDLGKEAAKVRKLRPQRYVLVTSVPLSPANKDAIVKVIGADVLHTGDILGPDDLNNRLAQYPAIEGRHYKLWLASRAVLDRVVNNAIVTQSEFKVQKVYREIRRYVQGNAFPRALTTLENNRVVILAGPPGVGKTTLANMLSL